MTANIGNIERILRILIGLVLVALVFVGPQTSWGWIGLILVLTGLAGWCPPYTLLGINTCKKP